jgi:hypothetical protein
MYAELFDDFKRKLAAKPPEEFPYRVQFLMTCNKGSTVYDEWMSKYMEATDIDVTVEDDHNTFTFYRIVPREPVVVNE